MSLPKWDDEMKFELLRLKSELKPENFRSLHRPIGLGKLTKKSAQKNLAHSPAKNPRRQSATSEENLRPRFRPESIPPVPTAEPKRGLTRLVFAHALDILFVTTTLGLGLLLASYVMDPNHVSDNPELLRQAVPLRFLAKAKGIQLVLGLYGFFGLYWVFFKLASGATLGESFLDNFWTLQKSRERAPVKDSGDS